jgi:TonB-dependent SusC/RagA subfamily outer membrane receptor
MRETMLGGLAFLALWGCGPPSGQQSGRPEPEADATAAVTRFIPSEADVRLARVELMLMGRVPGMEVRRLSTGNYTIRIRGAHDLGGSGRSSADEPLLVVDGAAYPSGDLGDVLASLTPRDVALIEVLRDAAATGAYGSRGANGVIRITTKRAR